MKQKYAGKILALIAVCALALTALAPTAAFADDSYGKPILETVYANDDTSQWVQGMNATYADGVITLNGYNGDLRPKDIYGKAVGISYDIVGDDNALQDANNLYVRIIAENNKTDYWAVKVQADRGVFIQECDNKITDKGNIPNGGIVDLGAIIDKKIAHVDFSMVNTVIYCSLTLEDGTVCEGSVDMSEYYDPALNYRLSLMNYGGHETYPTLKIKNVELKSLPGFEKVEAKETIFADDFSDTSKWSGGFDDYSLTVDENGGLFGSGSVFYSPSYEDYYDCFTVDMTLYDALGSKCLNETVYLSLQPEDTTKTNVNIRLCGNGQMELWLQGKNEYPKVENFNVYGKTEDTTRFIFEYKYGVLTVSAVCGDEVITGSPVSGHDIFDATTKYTAKIYSSLNDGTNHKIYVKNFGVYKPLGISVDEAELKVEVGEDTYAPTAYIADGAKYRVSLKTSGTDGVIIGALYDGDKLVSAQMKDPAQKVEFDFDVPTGAQNPTIKLMRWSSSENTKPYFTPVVFSTEN